MAGVLLIDESELLRRGCRSVLEHAGYEVAAEAGNGATGIVALREHCPDLVIVELAATTGGMGIIKQLLAVDGGARILVLSVHDDPMIAQRALGSGVRGYVTKDASVEEFLAGVAAVIHGDRYLSDELALTVALSPLSNRVAPLAELSVREFEIFQLLVDGWRTRDISETLGVTPKSVTNSYLRIKRKLRANGLADLVRVAINAGMVKRNVLARTRVEPRRDTALRRDVGGVTLP